MALREALSVIMSDGLSRAPDVYAEATHPQQPPYAGFQQYGPNRGAATAAGPAAAAVTAAVTAAAVGSRS